MKESEYAKMCNHLAFMVATTLGTFVVLYSIAKWMGWAE